MGSTGGRPLGEVLQELDGIIKLRQELQTNVELQPLFTPEWFASKIRNKVRELEGSSVDMTMVGGLNNLALLVRLHRILMGKGFTDLYDRLTAAINVQKSYVDCETDIAKVR